MKIDVDSLSVNRCYQRLLCMHRVSVGMLNSFTRWLRHTRRIRKCLLSKSFILVTVIFSPWKNIVDGWLFMLDHLPAYQMETRSA